MIVADWTALLALMDMADNESTWQKKLKQPEATSETIAVLSVQENFHNNIDLTFRTDIVDYKMSLSKYAGMAGTWSMDLTGSAPNTESAFSLETTEESVFDPDYRSLADVNDYMDGGKYRAIVKLQMRYEKQSPDDHAYAMGTGWLISSNLLATAGPD
ncbi:hypothetical protein F4824DRAFT_504721 [Ustulina deusta]|nr:hypothetical protein F4824DRAFT_504721 [Ustulina deusta]